MREQWKRIVAAVLVLALASILCLTLNCFDNKYTRPGVQPLEGLLVLSEEELQEYDIHFLIHGWAFYPGVLLTPEDLVYGGSGQYMVYTSIGEKTRFDLPGSNVPHGCGTYALTVRLPDKPTTYALEMPEIYSAYKLYINGELKLQMGEPEKDTYQPRTQSRVVFFVGGGTVNIVLAVSDYSHFYSGLVYPPALGSQQSIHLMYGARLALAVCAVLLGVLGALLACYLGIRMKHQNALLFALLCLASALFTAYPLLHTAFPLSIHLWYALEITCGYLITTLVIILQNRLCQVDDLYRRISETAAATFCTAALCYGLFSAHLTVPIVQAFSVSAVVFKLASAVWLLVPSLFSMRRRDAQIAPLFYASVFYGAMLVWDRMFPAYEPVLTGWFSEWGSLVMILVIGYTLWRDIVTAYSYNLAFAEEHRQTKRQLAMQMEYANQMAERSEENRRLIHDFRHHLRTIQGMAREVSSRPGTEDRQQKLLDYLETFPQTMPFRAAQSPNPLCNHAAVDALLQFYDAAALRQGVNAKLELTIPENLPMSDVEWCTVLGNLLENALESCEGATQERPTLRIATKWTDRLFFLKVENSYDGSFEQKGGRFLSRKRGYAEYGLGLESVRKIVEHYGGTLSIYPKEAVFQVGITMPCRELASIIE